VVGSLKNADLERMTDPRPLTAAPMHLRPFAKPDTEAVVQLWQACGLTRPWNDPYKDIARKLTVQPDLFVVGEVAGRIVASVMAGYDGHRGWINYLAVAPEQRRCGLARQLMAHVEAELAKLGCPKVNLQIRAGNEAVIAFYQALGYSDDRTVSMGRRLIADL
jgi:ribosomal protein S18 acetylase RimI-like enzyme